MHRKSPILCAILCACLQTESAHAHGGYHAEIRTCSEKLAAQPDNAELWFHRARLHHLHGDWKQSLADLDQTESLAPGRYPVGLARGQALMAGGDLHAAKTALDAFIATSPTVADAFNSRACVLLKLEDPTSAAADFQKAIALKKNPEPDDYVAWADACTRAGKPRQALDALDQGQTKLGALGALAEKAIEIELSIKDYDAALKRAAAQQALVAQPEPWMARRASILAEAGRIEVSRAAWSELRDHLLALPAPQRGSHAMSRLFEQAQMALDAIAANTPQPAP